MCKTFQPQVSCSQCSATSLSPTWYHNLSFHLIDLRQHHSSTITTFTSGSQVENIISSFTTSSFTLHSEVIPKFEENSLTIWCCSPRVVAAMYKSKWKTTCPSNRAPGVNGENQGYSAAKTARTPRFPCLNSCILSAKSKTQKANAKSKRNLYPIYASVRTFIREGLDKTFQKNLIGKTGRKECPPYGAHFVVHSLLC